MTERITTHLLVTLRHEKPIDKIADVVSCRLSMLEGVDGSGVDAVVVTPEAVDTGLTIEPEEAEALREAFTGDKLRPWPGMDPEMLAATRCSPFPEEITLHGTTSFSQAERLALRTLGDVYRAAEQLAATRATPWPEVINKDNLSREQFENTARLLTKGMGENITP